MAWNDLHLSLSMLFCGVMGGGYVNQFLAVWQNIPSDRAQRDVLKAAAKESWQSTRYDSEGFYKCVEFICTEATKIEDLRNNIIHSPLVAAGSGLVTPATGLGHIRAKKLPSGPLLLQELRWFRDVATVLRNFTMELDDALAAGALAWPKKPKLPPRQPPKKTPSPSQTRRAPRPPRRRSSPA